MVFFSFFKIQYKKVEKKNKHDVSGSVSVEKPKPVAFLCCKLNFYFHIHLWFLQALKQDNKRICSNVQSVSHFNFSQSNVALDTKLRFQCQAQFTCCCWGLSFFVWLIFFFFSWPHVCPPAHCSENFTHVVFLRLVNRPTGWFRPDHVKRMLAVHLVKAHYTLIILLRAHWLKSCQRVLVVN